MNKPVKIRAGLYAMYFETLKQIAIEYGYNLVLHGSLNRDLDLVAIPWVENTGSVLKMLNDFNEYLTGLTYENINSFQPTEKPHGRVAYVIQLNRGNKRGEWVRFEDEQYYLDISIFSPKKLT